MPSVRLKIHSASDSSISFSANVLVIISRSLESLVSVAKIFSGESGFSSMSSVFSNAMIAHSIISLLGSRVVSFCSRYPGALNGNKTGDWNRASIFKISYESPAITGNVQSLIKNKIALSAVVLPVLIPATPMISQPTSANTRMEIMRTTKINVVPQRSCRREHFFTFSTVRSLPYS